MAQTALTVQTGLSRVVDEIGVGIDGVRGKGHGMAAGALNGGALAARSAGKPLDHAATVVIDLLAVGRAVVAGLSARMPAVIIVKHPGIDYADAPRSAARVDGAWVIVGRRLINAGKQARVRHQHARIVEHLLY